MQMTPRELGTLRREDPENFMFLWEALAKQNEAYNKALGKGKGKGKGHPFVLGKDKPP